MLPQEDRRDVVAQTGTEWRRVRALFEAACERPAEQRARWVEVQCGGDAALLAELRSLLAADARATGLEPPAPPAAGPAGVGAAERAGTRVGAWRLEELIGAGGMGAVYRARRADAAFDKVVAVKVVKRGMDTDELLRRFENERRVLATMEHPGVARLLDGGSTEDGLPYLVMEHVDGLALDAWCDTQRLDLRGRIELFRKVCEAIDFAHRRGVVHRDLKPSNVLVDAQGVPKLLDFGIAKIVDPTGSAGPIDSTATEQRRMTPQYASPEQLGGAPVGLESDVYSLGVVLYELLTGRHPHASTTHLRAELEQAIREVEPLAPSTAAARPVRPSGAQAVERRTPEELSRLRGCTTRELRRRLSGDLDAIVLAALRKEPGRRYATAGALADDLGRLLAGLPVLARPDSRLYRARKFVRRNRRLVSATVAVFSVLLVGAAVSIALFVRAEAARREAVRREYQARLSSAAAALEAHDATRARHDLELASESERGWEWRHLSARTDRSAATLAQLGAKVLLGVTFDPSGAWLVATDSGGGVQLVDRASGELRARGEAGGIAADPVLLDGGCRLATLTQRRSVVLWELPALEPALRARPTGAAPTTLAGDPRGRWLAVGDVQGTVALVDPIDGTLLCALGALAAEVSVVAVDARGERVAAGGRDGTLWIWRVTDGASLVGPVSLPGMANALDFDRSGELLAVGLADGDASVALVAAATGALVADGVGHANTVRAVRFHPDGSRLASGSLDGTVRVWSVPGLRPRQVLLGHASPVSDLAHDPATGGLASVDARGRIKTWSWETDDVLRWRGPAGWHMGLDISPDGARVVTTGSADALGRGAVLEVRDARSGAHVWSARLEGEDCTAAAFAPDGARIVATTRSGALHILDAASGELLAARPLPPGRELLDVLWSPDASTLFVCGAGRALELFAARTLRKLAQLEPHALRTTALAVDPRGEFLLSAGNEHVAALANARSLATLSRLVGHSESILSADFHPTRPLVATSSRDETIRLWSVPDGAPLAVLTGHSSWVADVAFSPDGTRLASASEDRTVRLWSIPEGRELATLRGHAALVRRVRFAPDGCSLISLAVDGEVRVWDAPPPAR